MSLAAAVPIHLRPVLLSLAALPCAARIVVFGSLARGEGGPESDVDCHAGGRLKPPSGLLLLAQEHYPRLDPFWTDDSWLRLPNRREGVLMVRADDGRSWIPALNSRRLKADITTQGVPLASLLGWPEP